jgi:cytochrome c-type biogenesis protein CcmH/NrfG
VEADKAPAASLRHHANSVALRQSGAAQRAALCTLVISGLACTPRPAPVPTPSPASSTLVAAPPAPAPNLEAAQERVRQNPGDPQAHIALARAVPKDKVAVAAKALRTALKLDPRSPEAFQDLFTLYEAFGYTDRQLELVEARRKAVPGDVSTLLRASELYQVIGLSQEAEAALNEAMRSGPATVPVVQAMALWYYRQQRMPEGIRLLKGALARLPEEPELLYRLSELQRAQGLFEDAEKSIRQALRKQPESAAYNRQLAHILVTMKKPARLAEAETVARKAVGIDSKDIDARYWLAQAVDQQGKTKEAMTLYADISKDDIRYENVAYRLGQLYRQNGRVDEGTGLMGFYSVIDKNQKKLSDAVAALRKSPNKPEGYLVVADVYVRAEEYGLAVALLRHARQRFPGDTKIVPALRETLIKAGRKTEAGAL